MSDSPQKPSSTTTEPQRKIIHCDCDSFYASVEIRDRPDLAGRPVAVGGAPERRGVIATCNYEARRYGVHSAMPSAHALRLCPDLVVLRPDMDRYREASRSVYGIFRRFTDGIEPLSLDEAYLDVTGSELLHGSATLIAGAIRNSVRREIGITVSAGIAPNKFLAKVASDWNKPDGQFVVRPEDVEAFVRRLPVRRLPGVGPAMAGKLADLGVHNCDDLRALDPVLLHARCGSFATRLKELAWGNDTREVRPRSQRKSVSVEETYATDIADLAGCRRALRELVARLGERLARVDPDARISRCFVKVRFDDFTTTTAEHAATDPTREQFERLLEAAWERGRRPVRLLGLGVGFRDTDAPGRQLPLFEDDPQGPVPVPAAGSSGDSPNCSSASRA